MGPAIDIDLGRYDKTFQVNLRGLLVWTQEAWRAGDEGARRRRRQHRVGRRLQVETGIGIYNVTKAALIHLTKTLAAELGPGRAGERHRAGPGEDRHGPGAVGGRTRRPSPAACPLGRLGEPEDIADAALFLASDLRRGSPATPSWSTAAPWSPASADRLALRSRR